METILIDCVHNSLRHFMYRNAIFLCERLCAEFPMETNLQLLAACYLQNNQAYSAYNILKGTQMAQSRYLFALSCFQMELLSEAESALNPANETNAEVPNGAAGHYLIGLIYRYTDRRNNAIHHFKQALSLDPLLWIAYEELCILGAAEEGNAVFGETAAQCIQKQYLQLGSPSQNLNSSSDDCNIVSSKNFGSEEFTARQLKHIQGGSMPAAAASQPLNSGPSNISFYNTPSPVATQLSAAAPPPLCRNVPPNGPSVNTLSTDSSPRSTVNSTIQAPRRKVVDEGKLRKIDPDQPRERKKLKRAFDTISGRLFPDSAPRRSTRLAGETGANTNMSGNTVAANGNSNSSKYLAGTKFASAALRSVTLRKGQSWANENIDEGIHDEALNDSRQNSTSVSSSFPYSDTGSLAQEGGNVSIGGNAMSFLRVPDAASDILRLLSVLGEGYRLSCMYKCQAALDVYQKLPHKHYNTGWVLSQVGKLYFELIKYLEADRAFNLARQASPYSLEGMDIYSTVLYHLKEDMKLSYLAQELITTDRLAPQSWCAMGNCYSLQKDHETALKNFQRAVQLNPKFAYGHTLCGHEYVALEDYENGIRSYRSALQVDARHYNAWYGLGMIFLRQEKFQFSEHHFRMAFQINPRSSVIMTYLGIALHALKRSEEAIEMLEKAILADRKNPLPMYEKANILVSLESFDEALEVLEELKEYAPRETSVYALIGMIYKKCNMHDKAMLNFGIALDLKPSATNVATIKAAMEKLHLPDDIEDSL